MVLISPGYFSTAYFLRHCPDKDLTIIEGESSTIDCRVDDTGFVRVGFRNVRNPVGVYPVENLPHAAGAIHVFTGGRDIAWMVARQD